MNTEDLVAEAMKLKPEDRFILVESLIKSLDEPAKKLDDRWAEEAAQDLRPIGMERTETFQWRKYVLF
ncbi:MAG: addiction module protein [Nitrospira sp.]|nr:addiction module protein [Nitrospira sp.]